MTPGGVTHMPEYGIEFMTLISGVDSGACVMICRAGEFGH